MSASILKKAIILAITLNLNGFDPCESFTVRVPQCSWKKTTSSSCSYLHQTNCRGISSATIHVLSAKAALDGDLENWSQGDGEDLDTRTPSLSLSNALSDILDEDEDFIKATELETPDTSMEEAVVVSVPVAVAVVVPPVATKPKKRKPTKQRTKAQIKKLKFLMMQDVETLIQDKNSTAISKAQDSIQRLQKLYKTEGNSDYKPRILNYNMLVRAHGKLGTPEQAEKVLHDIQRMYKETKDEDIRPRTITYTEVIDAYAKSNKSNSAEKAEELLFQMLEEAENEDGTMDDTIAPSSITCDAVLNAWARRRTRDAASRAEEILERMEYLRRNGNVKIQPTTFSFATVISAWGKAKTRTKVEGKENAERAQFILNQMKEFLKSIEKEEDGSQYSKYVFPDTVVYNAVIDAWSRSKDPIAGTKAEALLFEMEELQKQGGNAVPDAITYNSVINCHAASGHINAAKAAEKVLKKMELASKNGSDVAPNVRTYNQVLKVYSQKSSSPGAAQRADMILMYMLQSEDDAIKPDVFSFSTCLDVWAKSKEPGKAEKAYAILQKMIQFYETSGNEKMKPNVVTYNTVFNACAFSAFTADAEKKRALQIAITAFKTMQQSGLVKPDAITYGMMIKCIANLVPHGKVRNKMASDLFDNCRQGGLVNGLVFDEIRRAVPGNVLANLLGGTSAMKQRKPWSQWELRDLPRSWRAKVVEAKPRGKRQNKKKKPQDKKKDNAPEKNIASFNGDPIRPMRRIVETSWQSGRDV